MWCAGVCECEVCGEGGCVGDSEGIKEQAKWPSDEESEN